ncbi:multiple sugar transport system substrate-binding protein [Motilibacter rhizosphaerae]|uniref:Multiple sugar transport system substrate-binding protein n=1 Tax=Motilibacter rhizosphaerae TaxID=598652 RepID=A0A4Q7NQE6_9ACTN|nr:ABC transporter substrate-binding protein [Motilibacter rhizosphaerae]RZS87519.1 multiple sugar transport system substrate-binding protein [Motilibacter rhizosphaerae]
MPRRSPSTPRWMSPSPREVGFPIERRTLLKGIAGVGAAAAVPGLAACGGSSKSSGSASTGGGASAAAGSAAPAGSAASGGGGGAASGTISFGSNGSDPVPKAAYQALFDAFQAKNSGATVKVNTVDHNTFQEQINSYLQGKPEDVFTWFAGYRMRFFAAQGLVGDISDVWQKIGSQYTDAFKQASTGDDGKQYFVPMYNYPWGVFYFKSVWQKNGWEVPKTWDDFKALLPKIKAKGMSPIGFADKDGWPVMGWFDIINMRVNGYQYHVDLMAHKNTWDDPKTKDVFSHWAELLPYTESNPLGRTWQEAAQNLGGGKSAMYLLGSFVGQQYKGAQLDDLDFFPFPEINSQYGQDSIDAPIDGVMMAKKPKNEAGAKALLEFFGSPEGIEAYLKTDSNDVAANKQASTANYNALQKKSQEIIASTKNIAQFMDRDTRPDFASTVMIPSLQDFIKNPKDIDGLTKKIESQAKSIFTG